MRSRGKFVLAIIAASVVIFSVSESHALHELFRTLDLNKDGKVDRNEFSEDMKREAFARGDANKDGVLSYE
ncbi:MAG: EF-hand domain-containing protein, partial [Nitrospirota bacterium]